LTTDRRLHGGLLCALAIVVFAVAAVALDPPQPLRAIAAGGLVVWAPGFALTMAIFPAGAIGGVERALLAFAASVALTMVPAVLLDALGVRLGTASFLVGGCVVTVIATAVALRRPPIALPRWRRPTLAATVAAIGVAAVLAGALVAARRAPQAHSIPGSSVLSAVSDGPRSLRAEVISAELQPTAYRVELETSSGRIPVAQFSLKPGGAWKTEVHQPAGVDGVDLLLFRGTDRQPYRRVNVKRAPA
jgi:hypothetical protein